MPPSSSVTSLLNSIRSHPYLPHHTWYLLAGVTYSSLNRADRIPLVFQHALETGPGTGSNSASAAMQTTDAAKVSLNEQRAMARRMREALIKGAVIGGLPKAINALLSLKSCTPDQLLDAPLAPSPTSRPIDIFDIPSSTILHRGQSFFDRIYGKVSKRVMGQMDRCGTEDLGLTARLMYGYILSNTNVLSAVESSYVLLAGLIPQDVNPQLKGHLKGALNNGATVEQVRAIREVVIRICEAEGMKRLAEDEVNGWGWRSEVAMV